jgi:hypothetical protein
MQVGVYNPRIGGKIALSRTDPAVPTGPGL